MSRYDPRLVALLARVCEVYRACFVEEPAGRELLAALGVGDLAVAERFGIGFAPGKLREILPVDKAVRRDLRALGLLEGRGYGREALASRLVVPLTDLDGRVVALAGLAGPAPATLKLAGLARGAVFNWPAMKRHPGVRRVDELTEALRLVGGGADDVVCVVGEAGEETERIFAEFAPREGADQRPTRAVTDIDGGFELRLGRRRYLVQGISQDSPRKLRAVVRAMPAAGPPRMHVDAVDLYSARDRACFAREAAILLGEEVALVQEDLARILSAAEERVARKGESTPSMSAEEERDARALLKDPALFDRILSDFDRLGLVGERENKLAGYLVAVSRKMAEPLSLLVMSRSAAGKSALAEAIAALVPPEDLVRVTRLTGQSLFYQKDGRLRNKLLVVEEESGVGEAAYPLRILQSARRLAVTTAQGSHEVMGPVAVIVTTTKSALDDETKSRFVVVSVDESREQTRAIHERQRAAETAEGMAAASERQRIARLHQDAQRLLRPLAVVNPFAPSISFPHARLSTRREQPKFLALIRAVTFLRQYQRPERGGVLEVTREDLELAESLSRSIVAQGLDDLSPPARKLLDELARWGRKEFTLREAREETGWAHGSIWRAVRELVAQEFLGIAGRGPGRHIRYEFSEIRPNPAKSNEP